MARSRTKIIVAGDVTIDWLQYPAKLSVTSPTPGTPTPNWTGYSNTRMVARPGGAMLLADMVRASTGAEVISPKLGKLENIPPSQVIHASALLGEFPASAAKKDEKNLLYRVKEFYGYAGPDDGSVRTVPLKGDITNADLIIYDDAGNGFRDDESLWRKILDANPESAILLKLSRPLMQGKLWQHLVEKHCDRLVVVVRANDLREFGVNISRRLSWERTVHDLLWQILNNPKIRLLSKCAHLIVRFGADGAVYHRQIVDDTAADLFYDSLQSEGGCTDDCPGDMQGFSSVFVAGMAAHIAASEKVSPDNIGAGVREGLKSCRRLLYTGFGKPPAQPNYPMSELFVPSSHDPVIAQFPIPEISRRSGSECTWTILEHMTRARLEEVANNIVRIGADPLLDLVPVAQFGNLKVIDRAEIESYQSVRNIMSEYIADKAPPRPLSIAVFGPPGSGKSFGVTQLAKSINRDLIERLEFNVAQFQSTDDLVYAFHAVRDTALTGKIPLVFFDEFDADFNGKWGWLKYFLAPMQDGKFKHGEGMHPIGKCILVFAGGTSDTFQKFNPDETPDTGLSPEEVSELARIRQQFRDAKGRDFVSRLRGFVNIVGPNPRDEDDEFFMIRRAMVLRYNLLERAGHIIEKDGRKTARIDDAVLRALIKVPKYKHGARSLLAIIDMSSLSGRRSYEQSALPPREQLEMHVDADIFCKLVLHDVLFGAARENLAKAIHERYRAMNKQKPATDPAMLPWEELPEDLRESNRQQADHYPAKLKAAGCALTPMTDKEMPAVQFTDDEIEVMAEMEHERWVDERLAAGWTFAPGERDIEKKTSPSLIPWKLLAEDVKDQDREAVRAIPKIAADAGFVVYRLP